jgi:exonuclease VII small subunit
VILDAIQSPSKEKEEKEETEFNEKFLEELDGIIEKLENYNMKLN